MKLAMSFKVKAFFILFLSIFAFFLYVNHLYALDEIEEGARKIKVTEEELAELSEEIDKVSAQLEEYSDSLSVTQENLNEISININTVSEKLTQIEKNLDAKKLELSHKEKVRNATIRAFYKKGTFSSLELLFASPENSGDIVSVAQRIAYYKKFLDTARETIYEINSEIAQYEKDKKSAGKLKASLEQKQAQLAALKEKLAAEVKSAQTDLTNKQEERVDLQNKLAELSAKQRALLAEKTGTFSTSVGNVPLADDPASRPDYNPGFSPAFAAFSFGAPHRKGMSQYGAYGRAKEGQSAEEILHAYYGGGIEIKKDYFNATVHVKGWEYCNPDRGKYIDEIVDLETYAKHIYEMPSSWIDNDSAALKAQAVAARSYALARGEEICPSECCQVYRPDNKGGAWDMAVDATRGWVLMANGQPFSAWYASTSGGFNYSYSSVGHTTDGGWDTKCDSQNCWPGDAYENISSSPWFYKAWYKTRSRTSCGRNHPWLNEDEFADIINAAVIFTHNSDDQEHLSQVDANSCWDKGISGIWDEDEVKEESKKYGGGVSSISSVDVGYSGGGYTDSVKVVTNKGTFEFDGDTFKYVFNLRAPGAIHLKSGLFNVERK